MTNKNISVTCIGLANVDAIASVDEGFLGTHNIEKAASTILDGCMTGAILGKLNNPVFYPGGCAANTACGIAGFDVPVRFIGKTGDDTYADIFAKGFEGYDITFSTPRFGQKMTSVCLTLVTPDKDRSFAFCTDAAGWYLLPSDLPEIPAAGRHYIYLESNTATMPGGRQSANNVMLAAAQKYKDTNAAIIINLNDREIVRTARAMLQNLMKNPNTFFIGNISEAYELFETENKDNVFAKIRETGRNFVLTDGPGGAYILDSGKVDHIPAIAMHQSQITNTIGAGDQFAAGLISGLAQDLSMADACQRGIEAATKIIQGVSARPQKAPRKKTGAGQS